MLIFLKRKCFVASIFKKTNTNLLMARIGDKAALEVLNKTGCQPRKSQFNP